MNSENQVAFTRTYGFPDVELVGRNGEVVNPSDFVGHELLVLFCPAGLEEAKRELSEYNSLADALAYNDAYMIAICNPQAGMPGSRVTTALDPDNHAWDRFGECLSAEERANSEKGGAFLMGRGGCLKDFWVGPGHAEDVRQSLGRRM